MKLEQIKSALVHSSIFWYVLFSASLASAQSDYSFQFKQQYASDILNQLQKELDIDFNYNPQNLPTNAFTFSCNGSIDNILQVTFSTFDRQYIKLDEGVYSVQAKTLETKKKLEQIELQGIIEDSYGEALTGAVVWLPKLEKASTTDTEGQFQLSGYFSENEILEVRYLGFKTLQISLADFLALPDFRIQLQAASHVLGEVIVTNRVAWTAAENIQESNVIRMDKMPMLAGKGDNDVLSVAQLVAGVYNSAESVSEIQMRGSPPDQTTFEWNNIPIVQSSHFYGKLSAINPFMVEKIEITRNGASAEDGGQAGGSILFSSRQNPPDSLEIQLYGDLLYSNVGVKFPLWNKKIGVQLAWRNAYTHLLQSNVFNQFYEQSIQNNGIEDNRYWAEFYDIIDRASFNPSLKFQDLSASVQAHLDDNNRLFFNIIQLESDFLHRFQLTDEPDEIDSLSSRNQGFSLRYERDWNTHWQSQITYNRSSYDHLYFYQPEESNDLLADRITQKNTLQQTRLQFDTRYRFKQGNVLLGYALHQLESLSFIEEYRDRAQLALLNYDYANQEQAVFLQSRLQPIPQLQAELGLRWSNIRSAWQPNLFEPRLHLSFLANENWTAHAHFGWHHQLLNRWESFTRLGLENSFWTVADELRVDRPSFIVRNRQTSVGVRYTKRNWSLNLDVFDKYVVDIWTEALDFSIDENPYRYGTMKIRGAELEWNYHSEQLSMIWTYDFTRDSIFTYDGPNFQSPYSQPHRLSLFQAWKQNAWEFSAHWRFAVGRLYSQALGIDTYFDELVGEERTTLAFDSFLNVRSPNYHSLDVGVQYRFQTKLFRGRIGASVSNLYNRQNILRNRYQVSYRTTPYSASLWSQTGLPRVVNVFLEVGM